MTEKRETTYMPYTETEREIDLKQLLLVICSGWKLLVVCMVAGLAVCAIYDILRVKAPASGENADVTYKESLKAYEKATSDKENWLVHYDSWMEEAYALLEQGMPAEIPSDETRLEVARHALGLLDQMVILKTARDSVESWELPEKPVKGAGDVSGQINVYKNAVIGLAAGLFLGMFGIVLAEILRGRILSAEELNARYGLRSIGVLTGEKEPDRLLKQFGTDHYHLQLARKEQLEVIASNLTVYAPDETKVLLTGSVDRERLQTLAEELHATMPGVTFETAPHILSNVASLQRLKDHAHVILVEQALRSVYMDVDREAQLLRDRNIQVIGSVTLY